MLLTQQAVPIPCGRIGQAGQMRLRRGYAQDCCILFLFETKGTLRLYAQNYQVEIPPPSKRHKRRMNRLFRERVGGAFLPFPEVDNFYERARSRLAVKLKINIFHSRREDLREGK